MKRVVLLFALLAPSLLFAADGQKVIDGYLEPAGYEQITSLAAAVGLTAPDQVKLTLIQAEAQDIRWRDDGTDPTTGVGMLLEAGQTLVYNGSTASIKLIETTASATVNVSYYR